MIGLYITLGILSVLFILIAVVVIRTLAFTSPEKVIEPSESVNVDEAKAVSDLAEMIKCKTVSDKTKENENEAEFDKFKALLPKLFPSIYEKCEYEEVGERGLLYRYPGKQSAAPTVLMAHYDVVSVEEAQWRCDPFSAELKDNSELGAS